jgi:type III secretory pathway component EscS
MHSPVLNITQFLFNSLPTLSIQPQALETLAVCFATTNLDSYIEVVHQLQPLCSLTRKARSFGLKLACLTLELALVSKHMGNTLVDTIDHLFGHIAYRFNGMLTQSI